MNPSIERTGGEHPGAETLAAFVDGRLTGEERREVIVHLDACPDCYEVFAETASFLRDEEPGGRVVDFDREGRRRDLRPLYWTAAAIAAVLLAVVIVPGLLSGPEVPDEDSAVRWAAALASPEAAAESIQATSSSADTAFGAAGVNRRPSAFRAGVRLTDLEVALLARDRAAARAAAPDLEPIAPDVREAIDRRWRWRQTTRQSLRAVEAVYAQASGTLRTGAIAEAGRLAAASGDAGFFRTPEGLEVYQALARRLGDTVPPPDDLEALEKEFERWIENP